LGGDLRLSFTNEREPPVSAIWTALAPVIIHAAADLNDVWVTTRGLQNVPSLVFVWAGIAALAIVLVTVWARRERALQRSLARLRSIL
jgi:hypothetical protein